MLVVMVMVVVVLVFGDFLAREGKRLHIGNECSETLQGVSNIFK